MSPSLSRILDHPDLDLSLLTPADPARLGRAVSWAHSTDLADPTPFVDPGNIVLTTGRQFTARTTRAGYLGYARRLRDAGVVALGFGAAVLRQTPPLLLEACTETALPLFEVPYRIPFIAVTRHTARLIADDERARDTWALQAGRAVSLAALRPDPLPAVLTELARQIGGWAVLYDAAGHVLAAHPRAAPPSEDRTHVEAEVALLLQRGQRSSSPLRLDSGHATAQTLGRRTELRGVLVVGATEPLDHAAHTVVTGVVALTGLALEQSRTISRATAQLRAGAFRAFLAGDTALLRQVSALIGGTLPSEPVRIIELASTAADHERLIAALERVERSDDYRATFALHDGRLLVIAGDQSATGLAERLVGAGAVRAGISDPVTYTRAAGALRQSARALTQATLAHPVVAHAEVTAGNFTELLTGPEAMNLARTVLDPLRPHSEDLLSCLRVWLQHNGAYDPAARELGLHRHTLKARIRTIEQLTGRDLSSMAERATLWIALTNSGAD